MNNTPILSIKNLHKTYGKKPVVKDLSFDVFPGEVVGLIGPNGAGKTTSFYMTIGLIKPDKGSIFFNEENITSLPIHKRALKGLGYLAQEPSIFRSLTVEQNINCILETLDLPKKQQKEELEKLLSELNLTHLRNKNSQALSGGERRRLEITRALVRNPSLLLLDEPFANIDPLAIEDVKKLILHLKEKGISVLITDHNAREIFSIVDRCHLIQDGAVALSGTVKELIANPIARKNYLGENFTM
ncbi:MAG TPA: LPS export ABC transporter ATP-binding protein [Chlamydiales bacterium]|nr:LPS export ABC transporter ATP-binding protein [Chlamydiales bacterium]